MININANIIGRRSVTTTSLSDEYQAVLDRGVALGHNLPTTQQQVVANAKISNLVSSGIWALITDLWMPDAGGDSDFACINYRHPTVRPLSKINSPSYTDGLGFVGNGTTSYISTSHATTLFTQNEAGMFVHIGNNLSAANIAFGVRDAANRYNAMRLRHPTGNVWQGWINQHVTTNGIFTAVQSGTTASLHHLLRTASNVERYWYNGTLHASSNIATQAAVPNTPFFGAFNNGGSPNQFNVYRFRKMGYGSSLVGLEEELNAILTT